MEQGNAMPTPGAGAAASAGTPASAPGAPQAAPIAPPPALPPARPPRAKGGGEKSLFAAIVAFLALAIALAAAYLWLPGELFMRGAAPAAEPFIIGGILPLTGDGASFGVPIKESAELAQKEINDAGGIGGRQVVINWRDGKCEAADAAIAAQELVTLGPPKILIGGACSGEVLASAPIAHQAGILTISSAATNPNISALPGVFRTAPSDALAGKIAAQYAFTGLKATRAAIITEDKAYPQGLREVFRASFEEQGGTIVVDEVFATGQTDFKDLIGKVKAASPEVIYVLPQTPAPGVVIVKELKEQEVEGQYLTAEVLLIRDAIVEQGDILEGVIGVEVLFDTENPKAAAMLDAYERVYGREAIYPHFMGGMYDLMHLIKEAYERTDGSTGAVAAYFAGLNAWPGTIGPITFDSEGDPSLPYQIVKITNKATERIDTVTAQ